MNNIIKNIITPLLFSILLTSCGSFRQPLNNEEKLEINTSSLNQFNGKYNRLSNSYLNSSTPYDFNDLFQCFFLWKNKKLRNKDTIEKDFVELEVIDKNRIRVSFIMNNHIEKSKILKGMLTQNTFIFNSRNFLIPLGLINFGERHRTRISLSKNGNLNLDAFQFAIGNFFIIPWTSGHYEENNIEFIKVIK